MELPKNIVQIGIPDKIHKIFVEDYVISYIKQLNRECDGKAMGLALYGRFCEEAECRYYFLYGATVISGLEHRGPYLSQVEKEEIEDVGKRYFNEYDFLAWCNIKGEPVEGFFVQIQGKGVEINGYTCFYEKNESMLNYMLLSGEHNKAKTPTAEKSEEKKVGRGEWMASQYVKPAEKPVPKKNTTSKKTEYMKIAVATVFIALCVVGITTLNDYEKLEDMQVAARQVIASLSEQKLPDAETDNIETQQQNNLQSGTNPQENMINQNGVSAGDGKLPGNTDIQTGTDISQPEIQIPGLQTGEDTSAQTGQNENAQAGQDASSQTGQDNTDAMQEKDVPEDIQTGAVPVDKEPLAISYTVIKGDTLISICMSKYGSLERMSEICEKNNITNPDNIQIGQTILLPQ